MHPDPKTIIIGACIFGVSSAIWLQRADHEVLLIDKVLPRMGASYGNAGLLRTAAKYLANPNVPLFLQWAYMLPSLRRFIGHVNGTDSQRIFESLKPLVTDSLEQHRTLVEGSAAHK